MKTLNLELVLSRQGTNLDEFVLLVSGTREYRLRNNITTINDLIENLNRNAHIKKNELIIIKTIPEMRIIKTIGKNPVLEIPVSEDDINFIFKNMKP